MKKLFLLATLVIPATLYAQELVNFQSPNKVTTVAYWSKGESRTFHVAETKSEFKNNGEKPDKEESVEFDMTIKVVDSTEHSYTLEMTCTNYTFTGKESDFKKSLSGLKDNIKIKYVTNEYGTYDSIINKKEIIEVVKKMLVPIKKKVMEKVTSEKDKKEVEAVLARMENMFTDPKNTEALFSEHLGTMHNMYGFEMILNKEAVMDVIYPALENVQMMGTGALTLREINKPKKECRFDIVQKPNKDDLDKLLDQLMKILVPPTEEKPDITQFKYNSSVKGVFSMDLTNGWMNKISITSTSNVSYKKESTRKITKTEYKAK